MITAGTTTYEGGVVTHELKTWPVPFSALWNHDKTAEFRRLDRDFKVGDFLRLREWHNEYTGRFVIGRITNITQGAVFGMPDGFALLSFHFVSRGNIHDYEVQHKRRESWAKPRIERITITETAEGGRTEFSTYQAQDHGDGKIEDSLPEGFWDRGVMFPMKDVGTQIEIRRLNEDHGEGEG